MKILHTSDWHLGQRFHEQGRQADEEYALQQIIDICAQQEIDVLLLAGDVFDTANPGGEDQRRYYRFLHRVVMEAGVQQVVVIAGNHDSSARIDGPSDLLEICRVHAVGAFTLDDPLEKCLIPLFDRSGVERVRCIALPYLRDGDVRKASAGEDAHASASAHIQAVIQRFSDVRNSVGCDLPVLVMAHVFAAGNCTGDGHERPIQMGGLGYVPIEAIAGDAAYVALGHLHRPQAVGGQEHWRYSGCLLPTGFDELDQAREVVVVDISDEGMTKYERHALTPYRRMQRLRDAPDALRAAVQSLPAITDDEPSAWLQVTICSGQPEPSLRLELTALAESRGWKVLEVRLELPSKRTEKRTRDEKEEADDTSTQPSINLSDPHAVFTHLLERRHYVDEEGFLLAEFQKVREVMDDLLERK